MLAAAIVAASLTGAAQVDALTWMAGRWRHEKNGVATREAWLAPQHGAMAGTSMTTRPGASPQIEFMTITAEPAGATFTAIVSGQAPTPFVLKQAAKGEAVFENLDHDYPQRVIYRLCGVDLCARIEGVVGGESRSAEWRYTRVSP